MRKPRKINGMRFTHIVIDEVRMTGDFRVKITDDMIQITGNPNNVIVDSREPEEDAQ